MFIIKALVDRILHAMMENTRNVWFEGKYPLNLCLTMIRNDVSSSIETEMKAFLHTEVFQISNLVWWREFPVRTWYFLHFFNTLGYVPH